MYFTKMPVHCSFPLDAEGRTVGNFELLLSGDTYMYGMVQIPVVILKNGDGPTVLLTAGNHGNEDQGQVIIRQLIAELRPEDIKGRVILMPALNPPAVHAFRRTSPVDDGNLNRSFPGDVNGSPTSQIADFLTNFLLPMCDAGVDLHSGGPTTEWPLLTYLGISKDPKVAKKSLDLCEAFGLPYAMVCVDGGDGMDDSAHAAGMAFIGAELGGGANATPEFLKAGYDGCLRVLAYMGCLRETPKDLPPAVKTRYMDFRNPSSVQTSVAGMFRPLYEYGDEVQAGDVAAYIHSFDEIDRPPTPVTFPASGTIIIRRANVRVKVGEFLYTTAQELTTEQILDPSFVA